MSASPLSPPPYDSDIINPSGITINENGVTPGSMRMSAAFAIWLQQLYNVGGGSQNSPDVLESLDEGAGDNSAQRQATEALKAIGLLSDSPDFTSKIRNLFRDIETQGEQSQRNWSAITGTHAVRLKTPAGGHNLKRMFFETDRNALYVSIANVWTFEAGMMVAVAANKPADLGTSDTFFGFLASDTLVFSYWTGAAWVAVPINTVAAGTYGDSTHVAQPVVDANGRITAINAVAIVATPTGAAGGRLAGTYPNPTLADTLVVPATYGDAATVAAVVMNADGTVEAISGIPINLGGFTGTLAAAITAGKNVVNGIIQP